MQPAANALNGAIQKLAAHQPLTSANTEEAFDVIMRGQGTEVQVAALLAAMRAVGETSEMVAGVVRALRRAMVVLPARDPDSLVDTCGTGGGTVPTFNISTAAAFVAAGAGVRIAKHGNRSFTTRCGSADVLQALGIEIEVPIEVMEKALEDTGMVFMFAPLMHPAMRHVGPVRRELAIPTVMNIVGPLANPARAGKQVVGVSDFDRAPILADALLSLGTKHALVVHGEPGLDEISPLGTTQVLEVGGGKTTEWTIEPRSFGLGGGKESDLAGGSSEENARIIEEIFDNKGREAARAAVVLNAAGAIYVGGAEKTFADAVALASRSIETGSAKKALQKLRSAYAKT
ncbi:MAG: anthranilate phosphoribosyltransferase [Gemmatimonadaceae bacterium]|nr:anthranilate phosphoribosyltransferase [Gemmatimonadaceae bacterium]